MWSKIFLLYSSLKFIFFLKIIFFYHFLKSCLYSISYVEASFFHACRDERIWWSALISKEVFFSSMNFIDFTYHKSLIRRKHAIKFRIKRRDLKGDKKSQQKRGGCNINMHPNKLFRKLLLVITDFKCFYYKTFFSYAFYIMPLL